LLRRLCTCILRLDFSRVAHKSDLLNAIRKVESSLVEGKLQIMTCSYAQVKIAHIMLPVRLRGTREPAQALLQGDALLDPALVNGMTCGLSCL
jgi:hypothetical protein